MCVSMHVSIFVSMLDMREFEETKMSFEKPEEHWEAQCFTGGLGA